MSNTVFFGNTLSVVRWQFQNSGRNRILPLHFYILWVEGEATNYCYFDFGLKGAKFGSLQNLSLFERDNKRR